MNLEIQNLTGGLLGLFADSAYRDYSSYCGFAALIGLAGCAWRTLPVNKRYL
jgi:hypothetical protein